MQKPNQKLKPLFLGIIFFAIFGMAKNASAANYYIDKDSIGGACNNSNAGTLITAPWCSISKANSTLNAGDTVYLRTGSYAEQINPANNGTSGSPITYAKYQTDTINITYAGGDQANLTSKSYITLDGLNFINSNHCWIEMAGATYCIIKNCSGSGAKAWAGINFGTGSNYNKILDNTFTAANCTRTEKSQIYPNIGWIYADDAAAQSAATCPADLIWISWGSHYNVFQGNTFLNAPHMGIDLSGNANKNIIRANKFGNTWHSNLGLYDSNTTGRTLVESNIIHDAGSNKEANPYCIDRDWARRDHGGIQGGGGTYNSIIRKNVFYENGVISITAYSNYTAKYSKLFNNTFHGNVHNLYFNCVNECSGVVMKNNSFTSSDTTMNTIFGDFDNNDWKNYFIKNNIYGDTNHYKGTYGTAANIAANWGTEWLNNINADPHYTNAVARDYTLQSGSPNIDAGDWLTTIISASGSGTTFTVADAGYFFDGWGISDEVGDTIQLQGQTGTAVITNVNYTTNTITVNTTLTWTNGLGVALAYSGSAPDIGAYEYGFSGGDTTAPSAPGGLSVE